MPISGQNLKGLRSSLSFQQGKFAKALGAGVHTYRSWERAGANPIPKSGELKVREYLVKMDPKIENTAQLDEHHRWGKFFSNLPLSVSPGEEILGIFDHPEYRKFLFSRLRSQGIGGKEAAAAEVLFTSFLGRLWDHIRANRELSKRFNSSIDRFFNELLDLIGHEKIFDLAILSAMDAHKSKKCLGMRAELNEGISRALQERGKLLSGLRRFAKAGLMRHLSAAPNLKK